MENYLGEFDVDIKSTEFKDYTSSDWAMYFIERYGQIDGDHHKAWVLDRVSQILKGTKVIVKEAKWDNGESEYRVTLDKPSKEYHQWVVYMKYGEDGMDTYSYDEGIAP